MAYEPDITSGTVSIGAGGTELTGDGTAWQAQRVQPGDMFFAQGWFAIVEAVNSNTSITLAPTGVRGAALAAGSAYRIRYQSDASRMAAKAQQVIDMLGASFNVDALQELNLQNDKLPYANGPGSLALTDLTPFARTLLGDANAAEARATLEVLRSQTGIIDATPDRNMITGAFGLGGSGINLVDYNNPPRRNEFVSGFGGGSTGDLPPESGVFRPALALHRSSSDRVSLLQFVNDGIAFKQWTGATQDHPWRKLLSDNDILGPVSQSGGLPTGKLIENGSNANGEYMRFANGLQICSGSSPSSAIDVNNGIGGIFRSNVYSQPHPIGFTSILGGAVSDTGSPNVWGSVRPTTTVAQVTLFNVTSITGRQASWIVFGRWY